MRSIKHIWMAMVLAFCASATAAQTNTIAIKAGKPNYLGGGKADQGDWSEYSDPLRSEGD